MRTAPFILQAFALGLCVWSANARAGDPAVYDAGTGILSIPELTLTGERYFLDVRLQLGSDGKFTILDFSADIPAQCTLEHVTFARYAQIPMSQTVALTQLDKTIGCRGELLHTGENTGSVTWRSNTSTATCAQYIAVGLTRAGVGRWTVIDQSIVGINSSTNLPHPCSP
jgi:hypothetical protein